MKKRGTSSNVADFNKKAKQQPAPNGAVKHPESTPIPNGQIAVMLTLMSDADKKSLEAREAQARVQEYAGQIMLMSGCTPTEAFRVNWDKKVVERIPKVPDTPTPPVQEAVN